MKNFFRKAAAAAASVVIGAAAFSGVSANAFAGWVEAGSLGDLNNDKEVNAADLVLLARHIMCSQALSVDNIYNVSGRQFSLDGANNEESAEYLDTADINRDGRVDVFDLISLRRFVSLGSNSPVYFWEEDEPLLEFIDPPIYELYGSMPSQGEASVIAFYVDFPDCPYAYEPGLDEVSEALFGAEDTSDTCYPFDTLAAFYKRSSKGAVKVNGDVYRYTTKYEKSYYENDVWHVKLIDELIGYFDNTVDYKKYDGDKDKIIDAILVSVPEAAGNNDWWPAAGIFGGTRENRGDGMDIGHVIVGNAEIKENNDHKNFVSSYAHEMGHCMGLPDYYLYSNPNDSQGLHGSAGFEMMDDAICDFGAASKLQLGWYSSEQINVFDKNMGTQTFTLGNAQTNAGNCIIIPKDSLDGKYRSEYFILEYATLDNNNKDIERYWWKKKGSGIRVYHVDAKLNGNYWYNTFLYSSGNDDATKYDEGRRFIRLVGEGTDNTDNLYRTGDVIDSSVNGFRWYDYSDMETVDPHVKITVGELENDTYTVTVSIN